MLGWWKLSQPDHDNVSYVTNIVKRTTAEFIQLMTIEKVLLSATIKTIALMQYHRYPPVNYILASLYAAIHYMIATI